MLAEHLRVNLVVRAPNRSCKIGKGKQAAYGNVAGREPEK